MNPFNLKFQVRLTIITSFVLILSIVSCSRFLDVEEPNSKISKYLIFTSDENANSAVVGMYLDMYSNAFAGGLQGSVPWVAGLTADELHYNPQTNPTIIELEQNEINPENTYIKGLWSSMFKVIYQANSILEGVNLSESISPAKKDQFRGEALFVRAFGYFYLVNLFGEVPLALSTDFEINTKLSKSSRNAIYNQIESDLLAAEKLLTDNYPSAERVRPNKATVQAFLSRVYLYQQNWQNALNYSTMVISKTGQYELSIDLDKVFHPASREAIWQLKPRDGGEITHEATAFLANGKPQEIISNSLIASFSTLDHRGRDWVTKVGTLSLPFKYKRYTITGQPATEYSAVFRLAEQYLIRAEARTQLGNISGNNSAITDINTIRRRAGLGDAIANNEKELMTILQQERKVELFSEWGHRWLDLKRWNKATEELRPIKKNWKATDIFYPIPQSELNRNVNLKPQNQGY